MDLDAVVNSILTPGLALLPPGMNTPHARLMLLAIGLQESGFATRIQANDGPAHSFWQMEHGGGVRGVLKHEASSDSARQVCAARHIDANETAVWEAMRSDDLLGVCFARLLLWTDPHVIPITQETGWACYLRNWRPGKPKPLTWAANYQRAKTAVMG